MDKMLGDLIIAGVTSGDNIFKTGKYIFYLVMVFLFTLLCTNFPGLGQLFPPPPFHYYLHLLFGIHEGVEEALVPPHCDKGCFAKEERLCRHPLQSTHSILKGMVSIGIIKEVGNVCSLPSSFFFFFVTHYFPP